MSTNFWLISSCVLLFAFFFLSTFYILLTWVSYWLCILYLKRSMLRIGGVPFEQSSSQSQKRSQKKKKKKKKVGTRRNKNKTKQRGKIQNESL